MGCEKPPDTVTHENCVTAGGKFPAYYATCSCVKCDLSLSLSCHSDGNWYANKGVNECG
jgi:hypothetical protein